MESSREFAVTWDYRCPFARNAHEHLVDALVAGAPWRVRFIPFFLNQTHVPEGGSPAWDDPEQRRDLTALAAGAVVRDRYPEQFLDAHRSLFTARHDEGADLRDAKQVEAALQRVGVDGDAVLKEIESGWPAKAVREEHEAAVSGVGVFGVPTFIVGDDAAFVRLMSRPRGDTGIARSTIEGVLDLVTDRSEINELKHTRVLR